MGKACSAFLFAFSIEHIQQACKFLLLLFIQRGKQPFIEYRLNMGFGVFQILGLFCGVEELAAAICGVFLPPQVPFGFQVGCLLGHGPFVRTQDAADFRLCDAGMLPDRVDQVKFCRTHPIRFHGPGCKGTHLPGNFRDFSLRNIHCITAN